MFFITNRYILPGFGIALGSSLLFVCLILLLPLSVLVMQLSQMNWVQYWKIITDPALLVAYKLTVLSAGLAALFNALFGMLLAWVITRYHFPGRKVLDVLIDLPFALPTAVAGLTLSALFASSGWYGSLLGNIGISVSYTWLGISIAMIFTSMPFVIRTVQPVLEEFVIEYEEVAKTLGADSWKIFCNIIFPELVPAWMSGVMLSFIRSLGEFGAVIFIAGNVAWKNEVISVVIFTRLQEFDYPAANAISSVILSVSLMLLLFVNTIQSKFNQRYKGY